MPTNDPTDADELSDSKPADLSAFGRRDSNTDPNHQATPNIYRLVGSGMELAGFTVICSILGLGLDRLLHQEEPYGAAAGTLGGFILGMLHFIRQIHFLHRGKPSQQEDP